MEKFPKKIRITIVGSGLTSQQTRLDIVAENVTNSQTTRVENGEGAYRRKMVVFQAVKSKLKVEKFYALPLAIPKVRGYNKE